MDVLPAAQSWPASPPSSRRQLITSERLLLLVDSASTKRPWLPGSCLDSTGSCLSCQEWCVASECQAVVIDDPSVGEVSPGRSAGIGWLHQCLPRILRGIDCSSPRIAKQSFGMFISLLTMKGALLVGAIPKGGDADRGQSDPPRPASSGRPCDGPPRCAP